MSFRDFTFPEVQDRLGLRVVDADLFSGTPRFPVRPDFAGFVRDGATLAMANSTENGKSEFIIAPVLLELHRTIGPKFALFSGVEWDVDSSRGLNGTCDFIIARGPSQHILQAPYIAIVEAINDLIRTGLGQCIASMFAASVGNERAGRPGGVVHGAVTTGAAWKFLRLEGDLVSMDLPEYYIDQLARIMGILQAIIEDHR